REAGDALGARERHVQRDAAAIGMADEMHLPCAAIDELDGARRFIGQREGMRADPRAGALAAIVLGRDQTERLAERAVQLMPLPGAGTGGMKRDHWRGIARCEIALLHDDLRYPAAARKSGAGASVEIRRSRSSVVHRSVDAAPPARPARKWL